MVYLCSHRRNHCIHNNETRRSRNAYLRSLLISPSWCYFWNRNRHQYGDVPALRLRVFTPKKGDDKTVPVTGKKDYFTHKVAMAFSIFWGLVVTFPAALLSFIQLCLLNVCSVGLIERTACNAFGWFFQLLGLVYTIRYYDKKMLSLKLVKWNLVFILFYATCFLGAAIFLAADPPNDRTCLALNSPLWA